MKHLFRSILIMLPILFSSCLTYGLEELPAFEDADIMSVAGVHYRYISEDLSPGTDIPIVKDVELNHSNELVKEKGSLKITASVRDGFPEAELDKLSRKNLVVIVTLSTAARIFPVDGSPKLGTPGDWSKPNTYEIIAANGAKKRWTIEVVDLQK